MPPNLETLWMLIQRIREQRNTAQRLARLGRMKRRKPR